MADVSTVNTRVSLWGDRWPAIALQSCVDEVEAAPADQQAKVKWELPCQDCELSTACLNAKRKELGPLLYDREILTKPRSSESSLFPWDTMASSVHREMSFVPYWRKPFGDEHRWGVCTAWDIAWSEKIGGDWLVKITGKVDRVSGVRTILDIDRWQRLTFDEQVELIAFEWGKYQDDLVVIESDFAQRIWSQHLKKNTAVPVLPHTAAGKTDMAMGIPSMLLELEQGLWEIPYANATLHHENAEVFLSELEAFGWVDGKLQGVGEHDDTVMAWYHLSWGLKRLLGEQRRAVRKGVQSGAYI